jgi:trehalose 6-phosphate synthase/phosphatase
LQAIRIILEACPELRFKIRLILIVAPSRMHLNSYRQLFRAVATTVAEINEHFGTINWQPILFIDRTLVQEDLLAYFAISDVALVTPLADGMNLVAKEYLCVRGSEGGVLILSTLAGSAVELKDALLVNPTQLAEVADALRLALSLPVDEVARRNSTMVYHLERQTATAWAQQFIKSLTRRSRSDICRTGTMYS